MIYFITEQAKDKVISFLSGMLSVSQLTNSRKWTPQLCEGVKPEADVAILRSLQYWGFCTRVHRVRGTRAYPEHWAN